MTTAVLSTGAPARRSASTLAKSRHICFVAPYAWPVLARDASLKIVGGAEVQQCILMRLLARQGWRVSLISLDFGQEDATEVDGVVVFKTHTPEEGIPVLRFLHPRLTATWRALQKVDADVYYLRSASMLTGVLDAFCRRAGRRSIYAAASNDDFNPRLRQIRFARDRWLYRRGLARVDRIVVQNEFQRERCREQFGRDPVLIPSCYEPPADASAAGGDTVLWVGRMDPDKRPALALEIAARLPQRRFVIVGGAAHGEAARPGYFESIRARAAALPNVEMTGFLPLAEVERRFDRALVLLNTSEYEGMPNTFLQAWARGVPTVATVDVGASVNDVFEGAAAGAAAIEKHFTDADYRARRSDASREYFQAQHSATAVMGRYLRLLEELVA
jgi:glycosyltransferase involved in cell wall biosynthesis